MTRKQIDQSRELRLWIGQVFIPAGMLAVAVMSNPEIRYAICDKVENVKWKVKHKFAKK